MKGDGLAAAARRLVREDTFERAIAPAIGDLQHEAAAGRRVSIAAYAGVLRTTAGALAMDLEEDLRLAFGASALRRVWALGALTLVLAVATRAAIQWLFSSQAPWLLVLTLPEYAASMLPAVLLPVAATFRRRAVSRRAVLVSAGFVVVLTAGMWLAAIPAAERAQSAYRAASARPFEGTPLSALPAAMQERIRAGIRANREGARHAPFAFAVAVIGYALLGWSIAAAPATVTVAVAVDAAVTQSFFAARYATSGAAAPWTPTVMLLIIALLALWVRREIDREHLTLRSG